MPTLKLSPKLKREFRERAIAAFLQRGGPKEAFAILLGRPGEGVEWFHISPSKLPPHCHGLHVSARWFPRDAVWIGEKCVWYAEAEDHAKDAGLSILGTWHSHPNCWDTALSENDIRLFQNADPGHHFGICSIKRYGKIFRARWGCWGAVPIIEIE
jgi:proteasome lid subunit RPN8/RPN11